MKRYPRDRGARERKRAKLTVLRVPSAPAAGPSVPAAAVPVPAGSVPGDVTRQVYCCGPPKHWYVDERRQCLQCGNAFVFSAREQKFWYETLQFHLDSVAVRCLGCRRRRRTAHALGAQVAVARRALEVSDADAAQWLALARALVEMRELTGRGDLNEAIGAARRAGALWPSRAEPLLWEGAAQMQAGRSRQAASCLRRFLERRQGPGQLLSRARRHLDALGIEAEPS